jgi:hypothetical protein
MNAIIKQEMSFSETMQLGDVLAKSGFFQDSQGAAQAIVKILAGRELGFGPVASMTGVNVIKGKVALSANLIAAAVKRSGRYNYRVTRLDNTECSIDFYEGGEKIGNSTFTAADAKDAGLTGDNWRKFPRNMLFARAMSNGAKWYCPDLSGGPLYTPDELGVEIDGESGEMIDITPAPHVETRPGWATLADFAYDVCKTYPAEYKTEADVKTALKRLGFTGWKKNGEGRAESLVMWDAIVNDMAARQSQSDQGQLFDAPQADTTYTE